MWIYYGMIVLSVALFGGGFAFQDGYRKRRGSALKASMELACVGSVAGLAVLLAVNGFSFAVTAYALWMAVLAAVVALAFVFCSFKALDHINLSLFSVFAMLGGMALPFLQGLLFFGEGFTWAKGISVLFICLALGCTVEKGEKKKGALYYAGVFVLNGLAGVVSKFYTESDRPKISAAGYSVWIAFFTAVLAGALWWVLFLRERKHERTASDAECGGLWAACGVGALYGVFNRVGNFLLVAALTQVDASVQYPMVTGGTMIVSTLISCFGERKPNRRELLSVALAFVGMLLLFLIPV